MLSPFSPLTYHFVAPVVLRSGAEAVLKVGVPDRESNMEARALRAFRGYGAVRLLYADTERGALLLERVYPGTTLASLGHEQDDERTRAILRVMTKLHKATATVSELPSLSEWTRAVDEEYKETLIPLRLLDRARAIRRELLLSPCDTVLLHGDLHHLNILDASAMQDHTANSWVAIDPKGVIGDPYYDLSVFLYNPLAEFGPNLNTQSLVRRRIDLLQEHGFEVERVKRWAFVQAVLSACWTLSDHGSGFQSELAFADLLLPL